jgi:hypothetical protein
MNRNQQMSRSQRGVAMVEFAIILPVLLLLLFGVTELGRALYQQNTLYKAVASGARYLARTSETLDDENSCATGGTWVSNLTTANNLIVYGKTTGTGVPLLPHLDEINTITITVEERLLTKTDGIAVPICVITIGANVPFAGMFGEISIPTFFSDPIASFNIRAETEERYIGY